MWVLYAGQLKTLKADSSDSKNDEANFKNLIKDLNDKLEGIKNGDKNCYFFVKDGVLTIGDTDTWINITDTGHIQVTMPAA